MSSSKAENVEGSITLPPILVPFSATLQQSQQQQSQQQSQQQQQLRPPPTSAATADRKTVSWCAEEIDDFVEGRDDCVGREGCVGRTQTRDEDDCMATAECDAITLEQSDDHMDGTQHEYSNPYLAQFYSNIA